MAESPTVFSRDGLGYRFEPTPGVQYHLDYIKRGLDSHTGEILIESTLPGMAGLLVQARFNLVSSTAQTTLGKELGRVLNGSGANYPWSDWTRVFFASCLQAERQGEPFQQTGQVATRRIRLAPLMERIIPAGQNVMLYGPGGAGKGYLTVGLAVSVSVGVAFAGCYEVQQAPVLYLDWEDDFDVFEDRVAAVATGFDVPAPKIHYRSCYGPLREQVHQIARYVHDERIGLMVVDSIEIAGGFAGEQSSYEDRARWLFEALRAIRGGASRPLSVLLIDHMSAAGVVQKDGATKSYGSIMKMNWTRLAWEMRKQQEAGSLVSHVGLYPYKTNHSAESAPLGFQIEWDKPSDPTRVAFTTTDLSEDDDLASRLPNKDRIIAILRRDGAQSVKEIAEKTGITPGTVRVTLNRGEQGAHRWSIQTTDNRWNVRVATARPEPVAEYDGEPEDLSSIPF